MASNLDTTIERLCEQIERAEHKRELRLQLIRLIVFRSVRPRAQRLTQPKAPPALAPRRKARKPAAWRCATCSKTGRRSLKNAAYCVNCARSQPIGAMA